MTGLKLQIQHKQRFTLPLFSLFQTNEEPENKQTNIQKTLFLCVRRGLKSTKIYAGVRSQRDLQVFQTEYWNWILLAFGDTKSKKRGDTHPVADSSQKSFAVALWTSSKFSGTNSLKHIVLAVILKHNRQSFGNISRIEKAKAG